MGIIETGQLFKIAENWQVIIMKIAKVWEAGHDTWRRRKKGKLSSYGNNFRICYWNSHPSVAENLPTSQKPFSATISTVQTLLISTQKNNRVNSSTGIKQRQILKICHLSSKSDKLNEGSDLSIWSVCCHATLMFPQGSKQSNWLMSFNMIFWTSLPPPISSSN